MLFVRRAYFERFLVAALVWCAVAAAWAEEPVGDRPRAPRLQADTGKGRPADADRAAPELSRFEAEQMIVDGEMRMASSKLAQLLNLDPSVRLRPAEEWVVPTPLVPDPITLPELIGQAYLRRPEFAADRWMIEIAILNLRGAQLLPFSPTTLVGFSSGTFGGGSNLQATRFGQFAYRADFDVLAYWTLQNMGVQNRSQVLQARSRLRQADLARLQTVNVARAEVADAYARSRVRLSEIVVSLAVL
jgi:outer membrane protein TolC